MKFVLILNSESDLVGQINGAGHICLGFFSLLQEMSLREFRDSSGTLLSTLTDFPLIVLEARRGSQMKDAHELAVAAGIPSNAFFECMRHGTPEAQEEQIRSSRAESQAYIALALFGSNEALKPITRKFSLLKAQHAVVSNGESHGRP